MKSIKTGAHQAKALMILLFCFSTTLALAQQNKPATFTNGTIVSSKNATIRTQPYTTNKAYDINILGVYYKSPQTKTSMYFKANPFRSTGIFYIKCNSKNGIIKKGDLITSSDVPGVGMKATKSGMIVGIALENASAGTGLVKARILIQYVKQ